MLLWKQKENLFAVSFTVLFFCRVPFLSDCGFIFLRVKNRICTPQSTVSSTRSTKSSDMLCFLYFLGVFSASRVTFYRRSG